jgi:hypothetical protein
MEWVELTPDQVAKGIVHVVMAAVFVGVTLSRCSTAALGIRSCACTFLTPATESALCHFRVAPGLLQRDHALVGWRVVTGC